MRTALSTAVAAVSKAAKKPSPVCLITSPRCEPNCFAQQRVMPVEELLPLLLPERLQQLRGVDDVREDEGPMGSGRLPEQLHRPLRVEHGPETFERRLRRLVLGVRPFAVALLLVGHAERDARLGRLVRSADPGPDRQRVRAPRPPLSSQSSSAVAMRDQGELESAVEQRRPLAADPEAIRQLLELGGRSSGCLDVSDRERHGHVRGKAPRARQRVRGVVSERSAKRGRGLGSFALGEPQQTPDPAGDPARARVPFDTPLRLRGSRRVSARSRRSGRSPRPS